MKAWERYVAVFDENSRKKLDRVPRFVQGVKPEFAAKMDEELFEEREDELTFNQTVDAAYILGFDAYFASFPQSVVVELTELEDENGEKCSVGGSGRVAHKNSTFYNRGMLYSLENLEKLKENTRVVDKSKEIRSTLDYYATYSDRIFPVLMVGGIFDTMWMAMGMKHFSRNYRKKTKLYQEIIKFYGNNLLTHIQGLIDATGNQGKVVNILDDVAFKGRTMIPPERWEQDIGPFYKEACSMISDAGMIPQVHTDGDVTELVPSFQKVGFRGLQGWEGGVDPFYINEKFPDFVVIGFGDVSETLPFGSLDEIDAHVKNLMDALKENRHYIFGPSTVIVKEMPYENVHQFMASAEKYGKYQ